MSRVVGFLLAGGAVVLAVTGCGSPAQQPQAAGPGSSASAAADSRPACQALPAADLDPAIPGLVLSATAVPVGAGDFAITAEVIGGGDPGQKWSATWVAVGDEFYNGDPRSAQATPDWPMYDTSKIDMADLSERITACVAQITRT